MATPSDGTKIELENWKCLHCGKEVMTEVKVITSDRRWSMPPSGWLFLNLIIGLSVVVCSVPCAEGFQKKHKEKL